jgi:hypothetical protein
MLSRELAEAVNSHTLSPKDRKAINAALRKAGMDGNGRFKSIGQAVAKAAEVLNDNGFEWGQVTSADLFRRENGTQSLIVAKRTDDPFAPMDVTYTSLSFQWTLLRPDVYEVVAYLG